MLTEISPLITPDIYEIIYRMGHLDELVIADANYMASAMSKRIVYSDCRESNQMLSEILKYFPLDYDEEFPVTAMSLDFGIYEEPKIWDDYQNVLNKYLTLNHYCLIRYPKRNSISAPGTPMQPYRRQTRA